MSRKPLSRILLVEDDPDVQVVASLALSEIGGLVVEVCGSALEALTTAPVFQPDLILMDVMMPGMDGIAALEALRKDPRVAATPVVFMTARAQSHEVARYRAPHFGVGVHFRVHQEAADDDHAGLVQVAADHGEDAVLLGVFANGDEVRRVVDRLVAP